MSARVHPVTDTVKTCTPRHDGAFLVVTRKGASGVSLVRLAEGARVIVEDGQIRRDG